MGVLEAWKDAEVVGYSIVGEEAKEASNVIDYNINEEITTNTSAVFNANNDTTTGMATVIPGVNAPKLLMDTSIYVVPEPVPVSVNQIMSGHSGTFIYPDGPLAMGIYEFTVTSSTGTKEFVYYDGGTGWKGMKCPYPGTYSFEFISYGTSSTYAFEYDWRIAKGGYPDDILLYNYTRPYNSSDVTKTFTADLSKGDIVYVWINMYKSGAYYSTTTTIPLTITKTA